MLNRQNAGALVSGASANEQKVSVRLLEEKAVKGYEEMCKAGAVVQVTRQDAGWLVRRGYAEYVR